MAWNDGIKKRVAEFFLSREKEPARARKGSNFSDAETVAILCVDSDEPAFKRMKKYVQHLHAEYGVKNVMLMSFVNGTERDVPIYHAHKLEYDYFTYDDLTWNLQAGQGVKNFVLRDFDILIDTTRGEHYPLRYVMLNSRAKMKVGRADSKSAEKLDLVIDVPQDTSFEKFMNQVDHYLSKFTYK
jgi:hypothetical protein